MAYLKTKKIVNVIIIFVYVVTKNGIWTVHYVYHHNKTYANQPLLSFTLISFLGLIWYCNRLNSAYSLSSNKYVG